MCPSFLQIQETQATLVKRTENLHTELEEPAGVPRFLRTFLVFVGPVVEQFNMEDYMLWRKVVMAATMHYEMPAHQRPAVVPWETTPVPPPQPPPITAPQPAIHQHLLQQQMMYNQGQPFPVTPYQPQQQLPHAWRTPTPTTGLQQAVPVRSPRHPSTSTLFDMSLTPFLSGDENSQASTPKAPE